VEDAEDLKRRQQAEKAGVREEAENSRKKKGRLERFEN